MARRRSQPRPSCASSRPEASASAAGSSGRDLCSSGRVGFGSISGSSSPRNSEAAPPLARRAQTLGHDLDLERASDHQPHHDQAVQDRNRVDAGKVRREAAHDPSHAARDDADREQAACADAFERGARDGKHDLESGLGEAGFGVRHQARDGHPELDAGKPQVLVEVEADEGKPVPQSAQSEQPDQGHDDATLHRSCVRRPRRRVPAARR